MSVGVTIAGIGFAFSGRSDVLDALSLAYGEYWGPTDGLILELETGLARTRPDQEVPTVSGESSHLVVEDGHLFAAEIDLNRGRGRIRYADLPAPAPDVPSPLGIDAALRALVAVLLPNRSGVVLHASGVVLQGDGVAFFGPSGAGKSTIARMFPADSVLGEELVALRRHHDGVRLHSTPFSCEVRLARRRRSAALRIAAHLRQADETAAYAIPKSEALKHLMPCVAMPSGVRSLEESAFKTALDLLDGPRWMTLAFQRDAVAVRRVIGSSMATS